MNTWNIIMGMIGTLGVGSLITSIITGKMNYALDKKKILFDRKLEAFARLSENILGLGLQEREESLNVFQNRAISANAIMLISNKKLVRDINNFFIELDNVAFNEDTKNKDERFIKLQEEGNRIVNELRKDLDKTLL